MNRIYFIIIINFFCSFTSMLIGQRFDVGTGVEINQTRVSLFAPTVDVPFSNPYLPGIGLSVLGFINYNFNKSIALKTTPLIGIYRTNSKVTNSLQLNVYGLKLETSFKIKKWRTELGMEYNRIHSLVTKRSNGKPYQWTPERRNLFGPTINLGYQIFNHCYIYIKSTIFLNDFYTSGALDLNGNVVGPVELTPYTFGLGFDFNISKFLKDRSKQHTLSQN